MKFTEFFKKENPIVYFQMTSILSNYFIDTIDKLADLYLASNGTGILPVPDEKKIPTKRVECKKCGEPFDTFENDEICVCDICHPF